MAVVVRTLRVWISCVLAALVFGAATWGASDSALADSGAADVDSVSAAPELPPRPVAAAPT